MVFYQVLIGKRPFGDHLSQHQILANQLINPSSAVEFPPKPALSDLCKEFITACLTTDVKLRPTVQELLAHPYLLKKSKKATFKEPAPK